MNDQALGRRFWTLWAAFTASNLGDGLTLVGFPLLAVRLTDDPRLVAVVAAFRFLPFLTVGLPAGVLIDRFDRRKIAMLAQTIRASALIAISALILSDSATIVLIAVCAFIVGVGEVLTDGGLPAIVRDVVGGSNLEVANSRLRASETVSNNFIGPPLGALFFGIDSSIPFFAAAALYVLTIALLAVLPGPFKPEPDQEASSFVDQMMKGLSYVWNHSVLRPLAFTVAIFSFFGAAGNAIFVILATQRLGLSDFQFGLLMTVSAIASVAMSFGVTRLVARTSHGTSMKVSVITYAINALLLGAVTLIPIIVIALILGGISDPTWNVISATVRQRLVDDHIFGRMMTAYLFIAWSIQPLGSIFGGIVADAYGPEWVFVCGGVAVGSLLVFARPMFQRIDQAMAGAEQPIRQ